jgi:hypothetical protein
VEQLRGRFPATTPRSGLHGLSGEGGSRFFWRREGQGDARLRGPLVPSHFLSAPAVQVKSKFCGTLRLIQDYCRSRGHEWRCAATPREMCSEVIASEQERFSVTRSGAISSRTPSTGLGHPSGPVFRSFHRSPRDPRACGNSAVAQLARHYSLFALKNSLSSAALSSRFTPPVTATWWLSRASSSSRKRLRAAPAFGSSAP